MKKFLLIALILIIPVCGFADKKTEQFASLIGTNNVAKIEAAIKDGANVNGGSGDKARTPLMIACLNDDALDVVKLLLKHGAKVNETDTHGDTALLLAAQRTTNVDIFKTLIDAGADVNARNKDQETPLMVAAGGNFKSAVTDTLIKAGANINDKDMDGRTPLIFAVT